jgi:hypothetical protein
MTHGAWPFRTVLERIRYAVYEHCHIESTKQYLPCRQCYVPETFDSWWYERAFTCSTNVFHVNSFLQMHWHSLYVSLRLCQHLRLVNNWLERVRMEVVVAYSRYFLWRVCGKVRKASFKIAGAQDENRTGHLQNTWLERYRYIRQLHHWRLVDEKEKGISSNGRERDTVYKILGNVRHWNSSTCLLPLYTFWTVLLLFN